MAKASQKKKLLMPEEKLDEALIPNTEEPYSVPLNWCWTKMGVVAKWGSGGTPSRKNDDYYNGTIPWVKTGELNDDYIWETEEHISEQAIADSSAKLFPINTIIIAMYGATIGKVGILGLEATTNQACACGVSSTALLYKYLFYYARSQKEAFIGMGKGGAQPNISQEIIKEHPIPLPPLTEQQRIVDRIESLFAKLDEAKEKAQAVVDGFEDRKAAILHKAFTGELTEKWRDRNGLNLKSWRKLTIKDVCHDIKVGIVIKPSQYYTEKHLGIPAFRSANVREFHVDDFDWVYLNEIGMQENQRSIVHTGDVLIVRSGNPGTACIVDKRYDGYNAIDILIAVPNTDIITSEYLCAFTNSPLGKSQVAENKRGIALIHFNVSGYSKLRMDLPTIPEQKRIIDLLSMLFNQEKQIYEHACSVIEQIDQMKKSILARAFRGELGTNDPNDESAIELLKRIL